MKLLHFLCEIILNVCYFFQNWLDSSKEIKRQIRSKYLCIWMLCPLLFAHRKFLSKLSSLDVDLIETALKEFISDDIQP